MINIIIGNSGQMCRSCHQITEQYEGIEIVMKMKMNCQLIIKYFQCVPIVRTFFLFALFSVVTLPILIMLFCGI
jgi:hypothetical protein